MTFRELKIRKADELLFGTAPCPVRTRRGLLIGGGRQTSGTLRRLLVESDIHHDPQALVLAPQSVMDISGEMVKGRSYVEAGKLAALKALEIISEAFAGGWLKLPDREIAWIGRLQNDLAAVPTEESAFVEDMLPRLDRTKFLPQEYGL